MLVFKDKTRTSGGGFASAPNGMHLSPEDLNRLCRMDAVLMIQSVGLSLDQPDICGRIYFPLYYYDLETQACLVDHLHTFHIISSGRFRRQLFWKLVSNFLYSGPNGTSNHKELPRMESASQPDQVHTNGSHGLKHEIGVNGEQSVEKQHLRTQSRDFAPLRIPAKLPPPFYPQHQTPTSDNSFTSTKPITMQQPNDQNQNNTPGGSNMRHSRPLDMVHFGGEVDSSNPSPAQTPGAGGLMYLPFPGFAPGTPPVPPKSIPRLSLTC